jgi:hypothetical protein
VNRLFEFHKTRQPFIGAYNEPLSVAAMRVSNPDRLPVGIDRRKTRDEDTSGKAVNIGLVFRYGQALAIQLQRLP